jgi:hypothetical protein
MTKEEALAFANSKIWQNWTDEQVLRKQLYEEFICVDWRRFSDAMDYMFDGNIWMGLDILTLQACFERFYS